MSSTKSVIDGLSMMYRIEGDQLRISSNENRIVAGNRLCYDKGLIANLVDMGWHVSDDLRTFYITP